MDKQLATETISADLERELAELDDGEQVHGFEASAIDTANAYFRQYNELKRNRAQLIADVRLARAMDNGAKAEEAWTAQKKVYGGMVAINTLIAQESDDVQLLFAELKEQDAAQTEKALQQLREKRKTKGNGSTH